MAGCLFCDMPRQNKGRSVIKTSLWCVSRRPVPGTGPYLIIPATFGRRARFEPPRPVIAGIFEVPAAGTLMSSPTALSRGVELRPDAGKRIHLHYFARRRK